MPSQPESISLATWNLERPSLASWKRLPAICKVLDAVGADIWILTESRTTLSPAADYFGLHSAPHLARRKDENERWVSIWSRWPIRLIDERPTPWSLTVIAESPIGSLVIRGLVLPYREEPDPSGGPRRRWAEFSRELELQAEDWIRLREQYPEMPFVIAGDFNQSLDGSSYYESAPTKKALSEALEGSGLRSLTTEDVVGTGKLAKNHLIDHVCISAGLEVLGDVTYWEGWVKAADGSRTTMSDHPGVAVQLARPRHRQK
jgi:endonuclease/exonuclease/phosphatase family metal-dependent hydrolase